MMYIFKVSTILLFYILFNKRREKMKEIRISHTFFTRLTLLYSAMGDTHQLSNNEMD